MDSGASAPCKARLSRCLSALAVVLTAVALAGCGPPYYTSAPIEAWVVDAETGAPIEGAVVTANWWAPRFALDAGGSHKRQLEVVEPSPMAPESFASRVYKINFTLDDLGEGVRAY